MFSFFSNSNKKKTIQSKSDHSDSETIDDLSPSTSSSLCENLCTSTSQILNLGPYRPILTVSTYYVFYIIILIALKNVLANLPIILFIYETYKLNN
jgi:hypothetical protein